MCAYFSKNSPFVEEKQYINFKNTNHSPNLYERKEEANKVLPPAPAKQKELNKNKQM